MRYILKQKIFSLSDKFYIKDEKENPRYYVESKIFSFGDKLKLFDLEGTELIYIEEKVLRLLLEYNIYRL
ncbi:MAG: LURP-one-related family protein, partial [Tissierellales bacterium]